MHRSHGQWLHPTPRSDVPGVLILLPPPLLALFPRPVLLLLLPAPAPAATPLTGALAPQGRRGGGGELRGGNGLGGRGGGTGDWGRPGWRWADDGRGNGNRLVDDGGDVGGDAEHREDAAVRPRELDAVVDASPGLFGRRVCHAVRAVRLVAAVTAVAHAVAHDGAGAAGAVAEQPGAPLGTGVGRLVMAVGAVRYAVADTGRGGVGAAGHLGWARGHGADAAAAARHRVAPARVAVDLVGLALAVADAVADVLLGHAPEREEKRQHEQVPKQKQRATGQKLWKAIRAYLVPQSK